MRLVVRVDRLNSRYVATPSLFVGKPSEQTTVHFPRFRTRARERHPLLQVSLCSYRALFGNVAGPTATCGVETSECPGARQRCRYLYPRNALLPTVSVVTSACTAVLSRRRPTASLRVLSFELFMSHLGHANHAARRLDRKNCRRRQQLCASKNMRALEFATRNKQLWCEFMFCLPVPWKLWRRPLVPALRPPQPPSPPRWGSPSLHLPIYPGPSSWRNLPLSVPGKTVRGRCRSQRETKTKEALVKNHVPSRSNAWAAYSTLTFARRACRGIRSASSCFIEMIPDSCNRKCSSCTKQMASASQNKTSV